MQPDVHYLPKTSPFPHQATEFQLSKDAKIRAIFWEQQTGKTKVIIDTLCYNYMKGVLNGMLVVAPNGVHRNWVTDEIPIHMPDPILADCYMHFYQSKRASTKWHQKEVNRVCSFKGLSILTMTYDAFVTKKGKAAVWKFMQNRSMLYVLDEAHRIKTPSAKRTRSIVLSGKFAGYKRIMTGTPVSCGPFDVYAPMRFLSPEFWFRFGFRKFVTFRHHFGIYRTGQKRTWQEDGSEGEPQEFEYVVGYQRLEQLHDILKPIASRVTKKTALPGLPDKVYSKKYFELTPKQRAVYDEFKNEYIVELDSGQVLSEPLAMVRWLRLHQITSNYVPTDNPEEDEPTVEIDPGNDVRLDCLLDLLKDIPHQAIIWARFTLDIDKIMRELKGEAVRYDGHVGDDERAANKLAFQKGEAKYFVGNAQAGAEGLSLKMAKSVIYFNNSFKLIERLQSEDRAHGIGTTSQVGYIDIIAEDTVDLRIVKNLVKKVEISDIILGDDAKDWL